MTGDPGRCPGLFRTEDGVAGVVVEGLFADRPRPPLARARSNRGIQGALDRSRGRETTRSLRAGGLETTESLQAGGLETTESLRAGGLETTESQSAVFP